MLPVHLAGKCIVRSWPVFSFFEGEERIGSTYDRGSLVGLKECKFSLIRYVPNSLRDEFVNIGVVLEEIEVDGPRFHLRITQRWDRVLRLDPGANTELLGKIGNEFRQLLDESGSAGGDPLEAVRKLLSNNFQVTDSLEMVSAKGLLTRDVDLEMDRLMQIYVEESPQTSGIEADNAEPVSD
jgi:hypothetical protein